MYFPAYLALKVAHILSMAVWFGGGMGVASDLRRSLMLPARAMLWPKVKSFPSVDQKTRGGSTRSRFTATDDVASAMAGHRMTEDQPRRKIPLTTADKGARGPRMIKQSILMLGTFALLALAGCGDSTPAGGASSAAPGKSGAPGGTGAAAAAKPVLEQAKNEAMGYTIKLPKGATTAMSDANGGSYGFDTMVILVGPTGVELKTSDDLLRAVNVDGGNVEKKTVGDAVVAVVTKPSSPVNVYAGPKGKKLMATCMAEPSQKDLAIEICSSLVATK